MVDPIITAHTQKDMLQITKSTIRGHDSPEQSPITGGSAQASPEAGTTTCRFAQQDMDIKKLSRNLELLQDRMLALEKSITYRRTDSLALSMGGQRSGQDMVINNFEVMLGYLKDAQSSRRIMDSLRSENEQLKQRLNAVAAPTVGEVDDELSRSAIGTGPRVPSTTPSVPAKKKRPYTRRKPLATQKSSTLAASNSVVPDSNFACNQDRDEQVQLGSLAALNEITAAMAQDPSTRQAQTSNRAVSHGLSSHFDENSADDLSSDVSQVLQSENVPTTGQSKRRKTSDEGLVDGNYSEIYTRKGKEATHVADLGYTSKHFDRRHEEPRPRAEHSTLQGTEPDQPLPIQPQDAATAFNILRTDETMIDPALRSTSIPGTQPAPVHGVLSSIRNPPNQKQTRHSAQPEKTSATPQYDSDQERRIREYKARDALRKRKSREQSAGKKKMDGEERFLREEKIRARDRMVKELMEREETLEIDGDL